jgi:hypothetical protein
LSYVLLLVVDAGCVLWCIKYTAWRHVSVYAIIVLCCLQKDRKYHAHNYYLFCSAINDQSCLQGAELVLYYFVSLRILVHELFPLDWI